MTTYSERSAVGNANGKVGKDSDQTVETRTLESQVMRDLVNSEKQVLVGGRAKDVGYSPELPREEGCRLEHPREEDLEGDDAEDDPFGKRFGTAELGDLWEVR